MDGGGASKFAGAPLPMLFQALLQAGSDEERNALVKSFDNSLTLARPGLQKAKTSRKVFLSFLTATALKGTAEGWKEFLGRYVNGGGEEGADSDVSVVADMISPECYDMFKDDKLRGKTFAIMQEFFQPIIVQSEEYTSFQDDERALKKWEERAVAALQLWSPFSAQDATLSHCLDVAAGPTVLQYAQFELEAFKRKSAASPTKVLLDHCQRVDALLTMWTKRTWHDADVASKLDATLSEMIAGVVVRAANMSRDAIITTLFYEPWDHYRPGRDKFSRCTSTISMWIVNMGRLLEELLKLPRKQSLVFSQVFAECLATFVPLLCQLSEDVSRGRWPQYRIDVLTVLSASLAFMQTISLAEYPELFRDVDNMCTILLTNLALLYAPVDTVLAHLGTDYVIPAEIACPSPSLMSLREFLKVRPFPTVLTGPEILLLVDEVFCEEYRMSDFSTLDLVPIWADILSSSPLSRVEASAIVSRRHEIKTYEYPPLTEEQDKDKVKLENYFKEQGMNQTV
jgi:hypothetical protein